MRRICVFCGSSPGADPAYLAAARDLGRTLAARGLGLVYGGARVGLMGAIADAALAAGGEVIGVLPRGLWGREVGHEGLTELILTETMHERKAIMADRADAFVALPGGIGTLEELAEVLTWAQLGIHGKPCALLDVAGYYAPFLAFLDGMVTARFLTPADRARVLVGTDPAALLDACAAHTPPRADKWLDRDRT